MTSESNNLYEVGTIICGMYIDTSPRYYIVEKITSKQVVTRRLKTKKGHIDKYGHTISYPGTESYGKSCRMTKKSWYIIYMKMICVKWSGDYESWFKLCSDAMYENFHGVNNLSEIVFESDDDVE